MPRPIARSNIDDTGHRVEALGSWDHGLEPYDIGGQTDNPIESVQVRTELTQSPARTLMASLTYADYSFVSS